MPMNTADTDSMPEYEANQTVVDLEEAMRQNATKCTKISTKTFIDGKRDTPAAIITLQANLLCELKHRVSFDGELIQKDAWSGHYLSGHLSFIQRAQPFKIQA